LWWLRHGRGLFLDGCGYRLWNGCGDGGRWTNFHYRKEVHIDAPIVLAAFLCVV
jgi:hypothetical protein